ncbi:hypothetical protein FP2506_13649 [Fulvimarina pelagi HTCC2506]|uniref:Uncharacterized protein n=1 Tax=Fulvimarina pelagi HTCC2506 TaxID=314231 RepID=Q0G4K0_9HYPH|nr:hypothetical protein FP2506_13649 [Fulvimarina pelagi HTCC2506]
MPQGDEYGRKALFYPIGLFAAPANRC